jgi:hypothetical protein
MGAVADEVRGEQQTGDADGVTIDLVALEAATQDLAYTVWELERLAAHPAAGPLRDDLERLHAGVRAALTHHREVLAGRDHPA